MEMKLGINGDITNMNKLYLLQDSSPSHPVRKENKLV